MNDEQIRKDFEEWMGDGGASPRAIERNSVGDYILMQTAHAWEVWKAAHTHYAKSAAPVVLPEPVSARYRPLGVTGLGWTPCYLEFARSQAGGVYELEYLFTEQQVRELLATSEQSQADALDAERWRFIKRKLCLTGNGDGTCAMQALNLPARIIGWPDVGELAISQFVDAAIDAALALAKENK